MAYLKLWFWPKGITILFVTTFLTYFPETNVLVPIDSFAHTAKTPASKSVIIRVVTESN